MTSKRQRIDVGENDSSIQGRFEGGPRSKKIRRDPNDDYPRACNHGDDTLEVFKKIRLSKYNRGRYKVGDTIAALQNQRSCHVCKFLVETFQLQTSDHSYRIYERDPPHSTIYLVPDHNPWYASAGISSEAGTVACPHAWLQIGEEANQPLICISFLPESSELVPSTLSLDEVHPKIRYEIEAFNGSIWSAEIDEWLKICKTHTKCELDETELTRLPRDFRLFDVIDRRVMPYQKCKEAESGRLSPTKAHKPLEFLTLSYVWGKQKWGDKKPYSLKDGVPKQLPQTMEDAICFTRDLRKRYLWVDLLCIDQDNPADLEDQLNHMDSIYSSSWLTLVGVDGSDWDHGLRAISNSMARTQQPILEWRQVKLMATYIHPQSEYDGNSPWDQRAFTLQERLLSRRCLLFADTYYAMICKEELFHDLLNVEKIDDDIVEQINNDDVEEINNDDIEQIDDEDVDKGVEKSRRIFNLNKSTFRADGSGLDLDGTPWSFSTYARLVSVYTRRKITEEDDIEKACIGSLNRITTKTGVDFHSGLPQQDLLRALLWIPHFQSIHSRRDGFPSWSWLGWRGTSVYPEWMQEHRQVTDQNHGGPSVSATNSSMAMLNIDSADSPQSERQNNDATVISPTIKGKEVHMGKKMVCTFQVQSTSWSVETNSLLWAIMEADDHVLRNDIEGNQEFKRGVNAFRLDQEQSHMVAMRDSQLDFIHVKSWSFDRKTNKLSKGGYSSKRNTMASVLVVLKVEQGLYQRLASVLIPEVVWRRRLEDNNEWYRSRRREEDVVLV